MKPKNKPNYYKEIIVLLTELRAEYPSFTMGRHLATALEEYQDFWGIPDSEFLFALQRYKALLEYEDTPRETNEKELNKIIEDAKHLSLESLTSDDEDF